MKTQRITTEIAQAADAIRAGQLVAVPTETVYGLAGNGLDPERRSMKSQTGRASSRCR